MSATIIRAMEMRAAETDPAVRAQTRFTDLILGEQTFGWDYSEASVTAAFVRHNAAVQAAIPAERLLVYEVAQGWAPLCSFLGADVPAGEFPRTNSRDEFWNRPAPSGADQRAH